MNLHQHLDKAGDHMNAINAVTYGSAASTIVIWGLRLSDIAAIVSACVAIAGLGVQIWVARNRVQLMRQRMGEIDRWPGQKS